MFSIKIEEKNEKNIVSNGMVTIFEDDEFLAFFQKRGEFNTWRLVFGGDAIPRLKQLGLLREDEVPNA